MIGIAFSREEIWPPSVPSVSKRLIKPASHIRGGGFSFDTLPAIGYTAKPQTRIITMKEEKLSTWWRKCRVVTCSVEPTCFEVHWWYIWFPFWLEYQINTHVSIERARAYAKAKVNPFKVEL